jgi:hypothetical protein
MQPLSDVVGAIELIVKAHRANDWAKLFVTLSLSGLIAFLIGGGGAVLGALAKYHPPAAMCYVIFLASGSISAGVQMTRAFRASPLTKGLSLFLPAQEAAEELKADSITISRPK